jgi:hypothetical protein
MFSKYKVTKISLVRDDGGGVRLLCSGADKRLYAFDLRVKNHGEDIPQWDQLVDLINSKCSELDPIEMESAIIHNRPTLVFRRDKTEDGAVFQASIPFGMTISAHTTIKGDNK